VNPRLEAKPRTGTGCRRPSLTPTRPNTTPAGPIRVEEQPTNVELVGVADSERRRHADTSLIVKTSAEGNHDQSGE
jgi:hypothetical protein